jgi:hypothetical protein
MYEERKAEGVSYEKLNGVNCFIPIMRIIGFLILAIVTAL